METENIQKIYTGLFKDHESVEHVYNLICLKGYNVKNVSLMMSEYIYEKYFAHDTQNNRSVGLGSPMSDVSGGINGVVSTGIILPGYKIFVAGPLSACLSGACAGGFTTGVISSLLGIPDTHAQKFESALNDGHIIFNVQPRTEEDASYIEKIWYENNVEEIYKK